MAKIEELLTLLPSGDIKRGQLVFNSQKAACASCHAIGYLGGTVGPDLTHIGKIRSERDLLEIDRLSQRAASCVATSR